MQFRFMHDTDRPLTRTLNTTPNTTATRERQSLARSRRTEIQMFSRRCLHQHRPYGVIASHSKPDPTTHCTRVVEVLFVELVAAFKFPAAFSTRHFVAFHFITSSPFKSRINNRTDFSNTYNQPPIFPRRITACSISIAIV